MKISSIAPLVATACLLAAAPAHADSGRLFEAAARGDLAAVNAALQAGDDANARAIQNFGSLTVGATPLMAAAAAGHVEVVQALLAGKAEVNARFAPQAEQIGLTALMMAAGKGRLKVVEVLLAAGADTRMQDGEGKSAVLLAVEGRNLDVLNALLAVKADPSPVWIQGGGRSALFIATMSGDMDVALALVAAGADVNKSTSYGQSPLWFAAGGRTPRHLALVQALLAAHANVEAGMPPKYKSDAPCPRPNLSETEQQLAEFLRAVSCGARESREAEGTPLGVAARGGSVEIVKALLDARASVNARQTGWQTPLMIAAAVGRTDVVRLLLAAGADVNAKDSGDSTALMYARRGNHPDVIEILEKAAAAAIPSAPA